MKNIILVGINHKTAPVELREQFCFRKDDLTEVLCTIRNVPSVEECVIISTCNRVEVYAVTEDLDVCSRDIKDFLSEFHNISCSFPESKFYTLSDRDAVKHLYRVASGIDSMVVGEPQILGQVKDSYNIAFSAGTTGVILNRLFQSSFFVAKQVRSKTNIGSNSISIGQLSVELSKRIFEDLSCCTVMLIGTGQMGELALKYFLDAGVKRIIVSSRNIENANSLSQKHFCKAVMLPEIYYMLKEVDIVITATGSSDYIIREKHIQHALELRKNEPMLLIDIAVPRDIEPKIEYMTGVYLYDIDDIKYVMERNMGYRLENIKKAETIISRVERFFSDWLSSLKVLPTIIDFKNYAQNIQTRELNRALNKLENIDMREKRIIESMSRAIIEKLVHNPITNLKKESSSTLGVLFTDAVRELFELGNQFEMTENLVEGTEYEADRDNIRYLKADLTDNK